MLAHVWKLCKSNRNMGNMDHVNHARGLVLDNERYLWRTSMEASTSMFDVDDLVREEYRDV